MKRRLRFISGWLALCLLGVYGFQAYWLYGSYQLARAGFARTAHEALEAVVRHQQLTGARQAFSFVLDRRAGPAGRVQPNRTGGVDSFVRLRLVPPDSARQPRPHWPGGLAAATARPAAAPPRELTVHTLFTGQNRKITITLPNQGILPALRDQSGTAPATRADSLARRLAQLVVGSWAAPRPADLPRLARAYRAELARRQATGEFRLDTLTSPDPARAAALRAGYPLRTPAVQLNPVRGPWVTASFQLPAAYVLRRMAGGLAGSALLLALTTGCFGLMLSTLFRQKKLADIKNDFINNMTHELKTPLATVSAAVEALQNFGALHDAAKTQTYLAISRTELQRLSNLVEKVLQVAVDEHQPLALTPEAVQPAALVAEIVARHQLQTARPVRFEVQVDAAPVHIDRLHLGNVLNNLIDNAIKYSREAVTITIRGRQEATGWHLSVADNGPGIDPGYQEAIFDQFFRVPTGNLHPVKGFGLGLYYVRQVVERHGGHIAVRSGPGRGSEFALWIPQG